MSLSLSFRRLARPFNPIALAVLTLSLAAGSAAQAGLIGIDENTHSIVEIDTATGVRTHIGFAPVLPLPRGITYDPVDDAYFTVEPVTGTVSKVDATTFAGVGGRPVGVNAVQAIAYDPNSGTLYVARSNTGLLMAMDPVGGAATLLPSVGLPAIYGLEFDATTNRLYGANSSQIFEIDTATGAATLLPGIIGFNSNALALDPTSGLFYGMTTAGPTSQLIVADPVTGTVTTVGTATPGTIRGLVYVPDAVSEPMTLGLLGLGLIGLGLAVRLRR